ncbi:glycoside hydrolase family 32 protein [Arthrobacter sp. EH-1B-1]|uniref:Glycoside hydrolase family 32 protein n=1 Tax=Arthrobacter vasquezii TaxID=2977629 RepID=A0ABT6CUG2_9MICC|nr:glycoside hydrolase family 32 protein [Arthrobacter vasquezii]MDF9277713.1 glycoside hydrolase family 32 protein [Arthrobacter vasquezii]
MKATTGQVLRPAFHFTPQRNWMNDPNGLVYHHGLWHLYFQYNPEGADWGNMSWGHATSTDLQHWTEHPVALPYRDGEQIFSGSVVNSGTNDENHLTAIYTSAYDNGRQAQSAATSNDGGFSWEVDADNPILDRGTDCFRDPKVIRFVDQHGGEQWILLAVEAEPRQVLFYSSNDLRSWKYLSTFGPLGDEHVVWECPDLFPLALDDNPDDVRWVLTLSTNPIGDEANPEGSSMSYIVGSFNGVTFTSEAQGLTRLDHGRDFYAGVTFSNAPGSSPIMLGWMSNWRYAHAIPSSPWRGAMSLPRVLSLRSVEGAPRLIQEPQAFIREQLTKATPATLSTCAQPRVINSSSHALLELTWTPSHTGSLRLQLKGDADAQVEIKHAPESNILTITRSGTAAEAIHPDFPSTSALALSAAPSVRLLLSIDGPLLEIFANDGESTASNLVILGTRTVGATLDTDRPSSVTLSAVDLQETAINPSKPQGELDRQTLSITAN